MNQPQAQTAITGSALVVGAIYLFRRFSETDVQLTNAHGLRLKQLAGAGPVLPTGSFIVGWGFTFLVLSMVAQWKPDIGGNFAVLVATGAVLGNGESVFTDLNTKLGSPPQQDAKAGAVTTSSSVEPAPAHTYPGATSHVTVISQGFTVATPLTH